jgi:hypothetical protein
MRKSPQVHPKLEPNEEWLAWFMRQRPAHRHARQIQMRRPGVNSSIAICHIYTCQFPRGMRSCILIWNEERINWAYQIFDSHLFSSSYRKIFQIWAALASPIKWACVCDMQHSKRQPSTKKRRIGVHHHHLKSRLLLNSLALFLYFSLEYSTVRLDTYLVYCGIKPCMAWLKGPANLKMVVLLAPISF